jgi:hypothetical protein
MSVNELFFPFVVARDASFGEMQQREMRGINIYYKHVIIHCCDTVIGCSSFTQSSLANRASTRQSKQLSFRSN